MEKPPQTRSIAYFFEEMNRGFFGDEGVFGKETIAVIKDGFSIQ